MKRVASVVWSAVSMIFAVSAATVCDVRSFGAVGDGRTKDTAAIQQALDACAENDMHNISIFSM